VELTKGYVELPMFESPAEARELAVKLLKDDIWRKDLSKACQAVVEEKCRFEKKFALMEEVIPKLTLRVSSEKGTSQEGSVTFLSEHEFLRKYRYMVIEICRQYRNVKMQLGEKLTPLGLFLKNQLLKIFLLLT
jgi:hypothetical protein